MFCYGTYTVSFFLDGFQTELTKLKLHQTDKCLPEINLLYSKMKNVTKIYFKIALAVISHHKYNYNRCLDAHRTFYKIHLCLERYRPSYTERFVTIQFQRGDWVSTRELQNPTVFPLPSTTCAKSALSEGNMNTPPPHTTSPPFFLFKPWAQLTANGYIFRLFTPEF